MNILYIGDVMAEPGVKLLEEKLQQMRSEYAVDLVIAQAENVTDGKGLSPDDFARLRKAGVDFCTGGNWTLNNPAIISQLNDPNVPVVRPANYPEGTQGLGYKYADTPRGKVLVISLLGQIVGRDADKPVENPLHTIDAILEREKATPHVATVVNFHGDFSSEKVVIGYYLDGRVTAVLGDHWHVPTADAMVLPRGTAHMTDVGMCGILHSSLGVKTQTIIQRWHDQKPSRNEIELEGVRQFSAALIAADEQTGLAKSIQHIYLTDL